METGASIVKNNAEGTNIKFKTQQLVIVKLLHRIRGFT